MRAGLSRGARLAVVASVVGLALPAPAGAQVRPDTVPRDTVRVPIPPIEVANDTLPADSLLDTLPDSLRAAAVFPVFPDPFPAGWAPGRWEWSRDELLRYRGLSLLELLERVPGITSVRSGGYGRPAGVAALGTGGARLRVFRDGFELDPLVQGGLDLQHVGLVDLELVRVDRTLGEIRVELVSLRLPDARPYSEVEIGTGYYDTKLLRAVLSRPFGSRSVATGAYDVVTTQGFGRTREPFQFGGGRLSWSYLPADNAALRVDVLQSGIERQGEAFPVDASRQEIVLRGRYEPAPGLLLDAALGRTRWIPDGDEPDPAGVSVFDTILAQPDYSAVQGMLRAGYGSGPVYLEAAARLRGGGGERFPLPTTHLAARGLLRLAPRLVLEGEAGAALLDGERTARLAGTARFAPFGGLALFATAGVGEQWVGLARDTVVGVGDVIGDDRPLELTRLYRRRAFSAARADAGGVRAGAEWGGEGFTLGAAVLSQNPTLVAPFGLPFDRDLLPVQGERAQGWEAYALLPVPRTGGALRLEGWYGAWADAGARPYLPEQHGRLALEYHRRFVDGQFEPTLRVETAYRGRTLIPSAPDAAFSVVTQPYVLLNWYLQLRILDVRAFLIWDNFLNSAAAVDVAGVEAPGPRLLYGVRWFFRN